MIGKKFCTRFLSLFLCVVLWASILSVPAFADAAIPERSQDSASDAFSGADLTAEALSEFELEYEPDPLSMVPLAKGSDPEPVLTSTSVSDTENSVYKVYDLAHRLHDENQNSARTGGGFTWDTGGNKRSWIFHNGMMMDAFLMLDEEGFASYANAFYGANITSQGMVNSSGASNNYYRENELESIAPARALFDLLRDPTTSSGSAEKYRRMIDYIYFVLQHHERVEGTDGNFKYKMNNANWETYQIILNGSYMADVFLMELAHALDDGTLSTSAFQYYTGAKPSSDEIYREVIGRMAWIGDNLYIPETQLYSHGWGPDAGLSGQYLLSAVGMYAAALADVISMLPDEYDEGKDNLIEIEQRLFDGMMQYQDEATGMWYNVINYGPELSDNELETSGTALIAYAMMKSYVDGYLDDTYGEAGLRAFNGTVMNYLDEDGLHNAYTGSSVETVPEGYLSKEYKTNDARGVAPLMMAATYANEAAEYHNTPVPTLSGEGEITCEIKQEPDFSNISVLLEYGNGTSLTILSDGLTFGKYDSGALGRQEVAVYYRDVLCGNIGVTFELTKPRFAGYRLRLSGVLGLRYFMQLPENFDGTGAQMTFTIEGKTQTVTFDKSTTETISDTEYRVFECGVHAYQMAENIAAVFSYGNGQSETKEYSVKEYLDAVVIGNFPQNARSLIIATRAYGHFIQPYLHDVNGTTHATLDYDGDAGVSVAKAGAADYALIKTTHDNRVSSARYYLTVADSTTLNIEMTLDSAYDNVTVTLDGKNCVPTVSGNTYKVRITNIAANNLGVGHRVVMMIGEDTVFDATASTISYVNTMINRADTTENEVNALSALYHYFKAAETYNADPST